MEFYSAIQGKRAHMQLFKQLLRQFRATWQGGKQDKAACV